MSRFMRFPALLICVLALNTLAAVLLSAETARVEPDRLAEYRRRAEAELRQNILPFWMRHVVDRERGGFFGEVSNDLVVKKDAPRGSLLTSRILWTYSAAYRIYRDADFREMADWAYKDLITRFWDAEHDGVYWTIRADGTPMQMNKQVYAQVFAMYALSEYYRATEVADARDRSIRLFHRLQSHARDVEHGGYWEVCTRDWKRVTEPRGSYLEPLGAKSQNTHLHVMEAFTNLLRIWPDPQLRQAQQELVGLMLTRILDSKTHHLNLFFTPEWKPTTDEVSYGHDIEAAWLLTEAAEVLADAELQTRIKKVAVEIARVTLAEGVSPEGGLYYEGDPSGVTKRQLEWWPQAEGVVGFVNAYQISGDVRYLNAAFRMWDVIETRLVDRKHGEWFRAVSADGEVSSQPKVSLWKCSYHNGRACMEFVLRLDALLKGRTPAAEKK
jgi:cellobiose epimerase